MTTLMRCPKSVQIAICGFGVEGGGGAMLCVLTQEG